VKTATVARVDLEQHIVTSGRVRVPSGVGTNHWTNHDERGSGSGMTLEQEARFLRKAHTQTRRSAMSSSRTPTHCVQSQRLPWRRAVSMLVSLTLAPLLVSCAASNTRVARSARRVPVAHIQDLPPPERPKALASLPLVLEIRKGDRFPMEVVLDSRLITLHTEGTWTMEAKQTFFVLLREDGPPVISADGVDFDHKANNSFGIGFETHEGQPAKLRIALKMYGADPTEN
jgi:hypothetical protein